MTEKDPSLPIQEHLGELRKSILRSLAAVFVGFIGCYGFAEELVRLLLMPLSLYLGSEGRGDVIFTNPTEPFMVQLKVALLAAFFLALPIVGWQVYSFLKPAFRGREKKYFVWLFVIGSVLFGIGANFGYFGVLPFGIAFLVSIAGPDILPQISVNEYFGFAVRLMFAFGLVFELPLAVTMMARLGLVDRNFFKRHRRVAILIIFVSAALLTPPDVLTQSMLAGPLLILYEISAQIASWIGVDDVEEDDEDEAPEDAVGTSVTVD